MQRIPALLGKAVRETGQALDRLGLTITGTESFRDHLSRHRPVMSLLDKVRAEQSRAAHHSEGE